MKITYYPDTVSMYIDFSEKVGAESREVSPGVVLEVLQYQHPGITP